MNRRDFLKSAGAAFVAAAAPWDKLLAAAPDPAPAKGMNLLFITADDMNATMPGWMGNRRNLTPKMDAFAATCHRFVNNRAAAPICQPSRQAMMTGLVPHRSGGYGFNPVRPGTQSLATVLKANGYFIAAINKITHMAPETVFPWDLQTDGGGKNPDGAARNLNDFLKAAKESGKPFFINFNITDPHRPFYGAGENGKPAEGGAPQNLPHEIKPEETVPPSFLENVAGIKKEVSQYLNSVQRLDVTFGNLIETLRAAGEFDRTVVVFVSDHGMPFPFSKATVYNHGPWTPALIRWPGMGEPRQHEEFTGSIDLMPTLLDVLGVDKPKDIDGRSWLPLLQGQKQPDRDFAISHVNTVSSGKYFPQRLAQTSDYALCFSPWADGKNPFHCESMSGLTFDAMVEAAKTDAKIKQRVDQYLQGIPLAFYDLKKDPDQRNNVAKDPQYRKEFDRHVQILMAHMERTKDPELDNFKLVLAGKPADIQATTKRVKQEEKELQEFRVTRKKKNA